MIRNIIDIDEQKIIQVYLIILSIIFVLFNVFDFIFDFKIPSWIAMLTPFIFLIPLFGQYLGLKTKYVLTMNILLIMAAIQLIIIDNPRYFHVIVYWIGIVPILIVSLVRSNAARIWAVVFLSMIILNGIFISNYIGDYELVLSPKSFMAAGIIYWLVSYTTLRLFTYVQEKYKHEMQVKNEDMARMQLEIETQNSLLKEQHEEINNINEELKTANDYLEERIQERTRDLKEKNEQLTEYAFINSHILRAPVARIVGLINLVKALKIHKNDKEIIEHLEISGHELDEVVGKINKALDSKTSLHRKHITPKSYK